MSDFSSVCEAFQQTVNVAPDAVALRTPGDEVTVTWADYDQRVRRIAAGLAALGVRRGDRVAFLLTNRPEFFLVDSAAMHLGAVCFSAYNTSSPEQLDYLFSHAGNRVLVTQADMLDRALKSGVPMDHIICVDGNPEGATMSLDELEAAGQPDFDFEAAWRTVKPSDVCTLIYTSGTTGPPKGVQITHANVLAELGGAHAVTPVERGDRMVSFLPAAHIADRVSTLYFMAFHGVTITCVNDPRQILPALLDCRPSFFFAVPRVWEKLRAGILAKINAEADESRRGFALGALDLGWQKARAELAGEELPTELLEQWTLAEQLVLQPLRAAVGLDQLRVAWSGAAPIAPETLEFFFGIGIPVCELWGMSELTGVATLNPPDRPKIGTVGVPVPGVECRLADDGELLTRGATVMSGYRDDPVKTAQAIDADGWVHTGDIATVDEDGYYRIVDRKKELIINAGGKNMSPANIENAIKAGCPLLATVTVIGDARPYNVALLTLDPDAAAAYAAKAGLTDTSAAAMAADPGLVAAVQAGVEAGNAKLSRVEQLKRFEILPTYWEPGGDELTPTMKLRRRPIAEKYAAVIEALYG
ncbi:MAG TPA: long-chain fatty acid--CoA ligase [Nocardioides sp.]